MHQITNIDIQIIKLTNFTSYSDNIRDVRNNNNNNNNNHPRKEHHHIKENHRSNGSNVNKTVESRHRSNRTHQFKDFLQGPRSPNN